MIYPTEAQLKIFRETPGAISVCEMVAIMNVVAQAPENGTFAEMGSHRGKSGVAAACAMAQFPGVKLVTSGRELGLNDPVYYNAVTQGNVLHMVDPLYDMLNLEAWSHACQGHPDNAWQGAKETGFRGSVVNIISEASSGLVTAELHGDFSTHAIHELCSKHGEFSYVLIDSDQHEYPLLKQECDLLSWSRMKLGGIIAFHDFQSQFLGVEQAYREMLTGGRYEEVPIDWEPIKRWVAGNGGEKGNTSWHHCEMDAPCFYGALKRVK